MILAAILITACSTGPADVLNPLPEQDLTYTITFESFDVTYVHDFPPIYLRNVRNPHARSFIDYFLTAACVESGYPGVFTYHDTRVDIGPHQIIPELRVPYDSGFPYYVGNPVLCAFELHRPDATQPNLRITLP
jgi:hypothetical protein